MIISKNEKMIKLSQCEYHFDYPANLQKMKINTEGLKSYNLNNSLKKAIAKRKRVRENQIILTNGALGALKIVLNSKKILLPNFSWKQYWDIAKENNSSLNSFQVVENNSSFSYDLNDLLKKAKGVDCILLPSPNNPTGNIISLEDLKTILKSTSTPIILDTAFLGFEKNMPNYEILFNEFSNLVLINSFSKFFGIPGLRCGYILVKEETASILGIKNPYLPELSSLSGEIAIKALENEQYFRDISIQIQEIKSWFKDKLLTTYKMYEGSGNFILVKIPASQITKIKSKLSDVGIIVKFLEYLGNNYIRIDVAPKETLKKVLNILNDKQ